MLYNSSFKSTRCQFLCFSVNRTPVTNPVSLIAYSDYEIAQYHNDRQYRFKHDFRKTGNTEAIQRIED